MDFEARVDSLEELRELYGDATPTSKTKDIHVLDDHCRDFIARSPFFVLATSGPDGSCDATPRGGPAGFVRVLDQHRLVFPDYPGNKRLESLSNIVQNPLVHLLFLIPGMGETLRLQGKAVLSRDPELLESLAERGRPPKVAIGVAVEVAYVHCGKALKRSELWNADSWPDELPSAARILRDHTGLGMSEDEVAEHLQRGYETKLY